MSFGSAFGEALSAAGGAGASALRELGAAASSAAAKASELARRAAQAGADAARIAAQAAKDAAIAARDAAIAAGRAAADAAIATGNAALDAAQYAGRKAGAAALLGGEAAIAGAAVVSGAEVYAASQLHAKVKDSYRKVKQKFLPHQPVAQPCLPCLAADSAQARKDRIEKRNQLIADAEGGEDPAARQTAARLRDDMKAVEMARLSENSYAQYNPNATDKQKKPPEPWKAMTANEALAEGLDPGAIANSKAVIYTVPSDFPFEPKTVVAFRGTTGEAEDILTDHDQALGMKTQQYEAATNLGKQLQRRMPDAEVTGHSLGGGKAQAAGVAGGLKGQMFNAAGLHPNSVGMPADGLGEYADNFIQYRAAGGLAQGGGDPLTGLQNSPTAQAVTYQLAQGLQGVGRANQWALGEVGIADPLAALPEPARQLAGELAYRILNVTPQEAARNKEFSGGRWYLPPAVGEVRGLTGKAADGHDSGIPAQHSITNLVYGFEARKAEDIQTLIDATDAPGTAGDYIGPMTQG